ncbi:MAG TPA: AsmA-like C-terminal region-containing protein [Gallionellaceae bacterium]
MNNKTVFVRTSKGEAEANGQTALLFGESKRVFMLVNNKSTVDELRKHAAPSLRALLDEVLEQLERDDFIRDKSAGPGRPSSGTSGMAKIAMPKISVPGRPAEAEEAGAEADLDFSSIIQSPPAAQPPAQTKAPAPEKTPEKAPQQPQEQPGTEAPQGFDHDLDFSSLAQAATQGGGTAKPKEEPIAKKKAEPEIDFASILGGASQGAAPPQGAAEAKARADAEARARAEMEAKKRAEAEAWARAEMDKKKRAEMEARVRAEMEAKNRAATEAAKARAEAEARSRIDLEAKIRAEMEAKKRAEAEAKAKMEAAAKARIEADIRAKAEAEARAKVEAAARARIESEARARAEAEARARAEAEARARAEAEARARIEAEARARAEAEARARAEAETRARIEAEARARAEAESLAKSKVDELDFSKILNIPPATGTGALADAEARARLEIEARMRAEEEAQARARAEQEAKARAEEAAKARVRAELEAGIRPAQTAESRLIAVDPGMISGQHPAPRSMIATVLFFDVVGYTKQSVSKQIELKGQFNSLIAGLIAHIDESLRIILDTGDGAAIGFLQHPEDALDVAMKFRSAVTANNHRNYPELKVRAGIHLGPVNVMKDVNGQLNMVGDGINDAQRIMSFAGMDQIYVSRAYFDVISRLTADSARLFKYNGTQKDKHGREHQVYQVLGEGAVVPSYAMGTQAGGVESLLQDLSTMLKEAESSAQAPGGWKPMEVPGAAPAKSPHEIEAEQKRAAQIRAEQEAAAARAKAQQEAAAARAKAEQEEAARKLAADQAKAFAEAEKRAQQQAEAAAAFQQRLERQQAKPQASAKPPRAPRAIKPRRPFPVFKIAFALLALVVGGILALPYVWPFFWSKQEVIAEVEQVVSAQLKQPVHISGLNTVLLPSPSINLQDITVGSNKELTMRQVTLHFNVLSLPGNIKEIDKAEIEDVSVNAASFSSILTWFQGMGSNIRYPLAHVALHDVQLRGDGLQLPAFDGKLDYDAYGKFAKASLNSKNNKISLTLQPQDKQYHLEISISESSLPLLPKLQFSSLDAPGDISDSSINFPSISGNMYGGIMRGSATLSWKSGWQLQGRVTISSMPAEKALPSLKVTGDIEGEATFSSSGDKLPKLANAPRLDGTFRIRDGAITSMDLAESARSDITKLFPGTTHFDLLNGTLRIDSNGQHLKPLKISAGMMSMSGSADATPDGRLTGQLQVDLSKVRPGAGTLPLTLNGTVSDPVWNIGRR